MIFSITGAEDQGRCTLFWLRFFEVGKPGYYRPVLSWGSERSNVRAEDLVAAGSFEAMRAARRLLST